MAPGYLSYAQAKSYGRFHEGAWECFSTMGLKTKRLITLNAPGAIVFDAELRTKFQYHLIRLSHASLQLVGT